MEANETTMLIEDESFRNNDTINTTLALPPVAGFWRRFGAWIIDSLLFVLVGQILGWMMPSVWYKIGPYGRFLGLFLGLLYFGLMDSYLGNGQTIGKRLFKISVRDSKNKSIGIGRSVLRTSIIIAPLILDGWALPIFQNPILMWFLGIIIFGVGGSVLYTMLFNRRARQGFHDLICKTYVVHLRGNPIESFPQTAKLHWIVSIVIFSTVIAGTTAFGMIGSFLISKTKLAPVYALYQNLQPDSRFFTVNVMEGMLYTSRGESIHSLEVSVWYKGVLSENERTPLINDIAKAVLLNAEEIDQYDLLTISITSGFDLGIGTGYTAFGDRQPISVWRDRINSIGASQ